MLRSAWPVNFKIPFLHLASPRGPGVRNSASWPTHAGSPSLPIVLAWALRARGEGARLRSEGSRPPHHAGRCLWPRPVSSQSPEGSVWLLSFFLFLENGNDLFSSISWKENLKRILWPKSARLGVPRRPQATLLGAALSLQLLGTSRETQQPVLASSRPHKPGSLNRLCNHGTQLASKGSTPETNVKTQGSHTESINLIPTERGSFFC